MFGERERYGRRTFREQLEEAHDWILAHRRAGLAALIAVAILGWLALLGLPVRPQDLAVGDCLFVRTPAVEEPGPDARPIGEPVEVADAVLAGTATRAACFLSHGHEVAALIDYPRAENPRGLMLAVQHACDRAFDDYVGRAPELSIYEAFAAVPSAERWEAGVRNAICLVARRDGLWMDHPARGSGE